MRLRRPLTVSTAAAALVLAIALPAGAHPFFTEGGIAPAGSLTTLTLSMAHGCGTEDDAGGDPTIEVSVEVPPSFSYLEPLDLEGFEVSVEGEAGEVPEVVTWTATDAQVPAPEFAMNAVVEGEVDDEVYVGVFQGCDGFAYRWVGTPDDPADDPAVRLVLTEPDPDAPPPPSPTDTPADPEVDELDDGQVAAEDDAEVEADPEEEPTTVEELPTEPPEDEGEPGGLGWLPIVIGAIVLAGLGAALGTKLAARRRAEGSGPDDGTGTTPPSVDR
jgi:uncharacterized protein YcnI